MPKSLFFCPGGKTGEQRIPGPRKKGRRSGPSPARTRASLRHRAAELRDPHGRENKADPKADGRSGHEEVVRGREEGGEQLKELLELSRYCGDSFRGYVLLNNRRIPQTRIATRTVRDHAKTIQAPTVCGDHGTAVNGRNLFRATRVKNKDSLFKERAQRPSTKCYSTTLQGRENLRRLRLKQTDAGVSPRRVPDCSFNNRDYPLGG
ncbi:hypothetical protein ACROYT_G000545 [Oculina patagonica]